MTLISIDGFDWVDGINRSAERAYDSCYEIGGILSMAVLAGFVSPEVVNRCFSSQCVAFDRIDNVARGYLYWRFGESSKNVRIISTRHIEDVRVTSPFQNLFQQLNESALKVVLVRMNDIYLEQLLSADCLLFKRCWTLITAESQNFPYPYLQHTLYRLIHSHLEVAGVRKVFTVWNNENLKLWLSGDLRTLNECLGKKSIKIDSEQKIIKHVARKILEDDLIRVWTTMEKTLSKVRLQGDSSLGMAFYEGLLERSGKPEVCLQVLIERVHSVVNRPLYTASNWIDELRQEFKTGNIFDTWH
jgi:hypothetical protein